MSNFINDEEKMFGVTYKSEARASPPGLSIRKMTALNFFDSEIIRHALVKTQTARAYKGLKVHFILITEKRM